MGVFVIKYFFSWDGGYANFDLEFDEETISLLNNPPEEIPNWAKLSYCQCPNCPLDSNEVEYCPTAVSFIPVVDSFKNIESDSEVEVEVRVANRKVAMRAPARRAISSVVGLLFAGSGCPRTLYFRPMVRYHIPVATEDETIMRAMSMFLLAQYFKYKSGKKPDLELAGLRKIYDELQIVNMTMAERLRSIEGTTLPVNSVILLDMYTKIIPDKIDTSLKDLSYLFNTFLNKI
ncbi:MAG: hypothetical protein KJ950_13775 [Proteobacteria bacterium]|nr:hypothetical protein [Pseudomonadota bacterium]MBU1686078.1 hypothetical protein [Pseudomonadota bacterium]